MSTTSNEEIIQQAEIPEIKVPKKRTRKERTPAQIEVLEKARSKRKEAFALQRASKQKLEEILKMGGTIEELAKKTKKTHITNKDVARQLDASSVLISEPEPEVKVKPKRKRKKVVVVDSPSESEDETEEPQYIPQQQRYDYEW
jgi:hypothetical protein